MKRSRSQKLLAVWGSPGSGKTTLAAKLAWHYEKEGFRTALVFCDWSTPMLPCMREEGELSEQHSLGSIFAARRIVPALVEANACQVKGAEQLGLYGLLKGEYETLYPPVSKRQAEEFLGVLKEQYDVAVLDLTSEVHEQVLTETGLRKADEVVRLLGCELKSLSFYKSQLAYLHEETIEDRYFYRVISDVKDQMLAKAMYQKAAFQLQHTEELVKQWERGDLFGELEEKQSRGYLEGLRALAEELISE